MESARGGTKQKAMIRRFVPLGYTVLVFDFSYVGDSEGCFEDMTVRGEVEDVHGALDFAAEFRARSYTLIGSSLGGTVALLAAVERAEQVGSVATIAAVADAGLFTRGLSEQDLRDWRASGSRRWHESRMKRSFLDDVESLDIPAALSALRCPLLVTHGSVDSVVPAAHARLIERSVAGPVEVEIFAGVDHRFEEVGALTALIDGLQRWLVRVTGPTRGCG